MKFRSLWLILSRLFIVFIVILFILGCRTMTRQEKTSPPKILRKIHQNSSAHTQNIAELTGRNHPYGRPVFGGKLPWEGRSRFKNLVKSGGTTIRLAAFQTTLPDPLPGEEANVALAADMLAGTVIQPGKVFSMNRVIGPYTKARGFRDGPAYIGDRVIKTTGGGVCKIATTLYNVVVLADLKIVERHPHGMPVPYVPAGQDATVAEGSKDFCFANTTIAPALIWADTRGNTLTIAIYGQKKPPSVEWRHQIVKRWPTRVVYRKNKDLKPGMEKVVVPGAEGLIIRTKLIVKYRKGGFIERDMGTDVYQPLPHVIEKG